MCIPFPATVVPLWLMTGWAGLIDTFWPLILPIPSMLGVVLIRQAIVAIPREMFECARLDGCNDMRIFTKIVTPIIRPILITVGILYFSRKLEQSALAADCGEYGPDKDASGRTCSPAGNNRC